MADHTNDYVKISRPLWVLLQEEAHKVMAHGKICPWCKKSIMWTCNMQIVHRFGIPTKRTQTMPSWIYFDKLAWDWVCSETCALAMSQSWAMSLRARPALENRIKIKGPDAKMKPKRHEDYRSYILRMGRVGIDDGRTFVNPAEHPYYINWDLIST